MALKGLIYIVNIMISSICLVSFLWGIVKLCLSLEKSKYSDLKNYQFDTIVKYLVFPLYILSGSGYKIHEELKETIIFPIRIIIITLEYLLVFQIFCYQLLHYRF